MAGSYRKVCPKACVRGEEGVIKHETGTDAFETSFIVKSSQPRIHNEILSPKK